VRTLAHRLAASQRGHAGVILVYGIDHSEFAVIARIERWLELRAGQAEWSDFPRSSTADSPGDSPRDPYGLQLPHSSR
jgi:hypothetical protein